MTIINPHSISGISSITALNSTAAINLLNADGTSANIIAGVTTGSNFITGTSNVHSTGYECTNINASGIITATSMDMISTDAGSSAAPEFKLYRNSASPADADYLGQIKFAGESDTGVERNYAKITGKILDASNGTEDGIIEFAHIKAGSQNISARFRSDSLQLLNGTALTVAGTSTFNGDMTGAAGVDLNLDSTLGSGANTVFSGFDGRLIFDTSYSDTARGPNKIQLQNTGGWVGGFGISSNTLDIYTGGLTRFSRSTNTDTYSTQLTIDHEGNLLPTGDVRLTSTAGSNTSTSVENSAWSRLEFDTDYSDTARGPNKIVLQQTGNWYGGFGISSNSFDVYTGGILHFYGKTNTNDAANIETLAKFTTDGAVELYHDGTKTAYTHNSGFNIKGKNTSDNTELQIFGNEGQAASILMSADDGDDNADHWRMYSNADNSFTLNSYAGGSYQSILKGTSSRSIELNYQGSKRFETTTDGIKLSTPSSTSTDANLLHIVGGGTADRGLKIGTGRATGANQNHAAAIYDAINSESSGYGSQHRFKIAGTDCFTIGYNGDFGYVGVNDSIPYPDAVSGNTVNTCLELGSPSGTDTASVIRFNGRDGGGNLNRCQIQWAGANNRFDITVNGNQALQIQPNKDVEVTDGDLIIGTAGHGINFSAAGGSNAGSSSATLDDYEEGSFTAILRSNSNPGNTGYNYDTSSNFTSYYTKIGNIVYVSISLSNLHSSPDLRNHQLIRVEGLPFTTARRCGINVVDGRGIYPRWSTDSQTTNAATTTVWADGSSTYFYLQFYLHSTPYTLWATVHNSTSSQRWHLAGCYPVA